MSQEAESPPPVPPSPPSWGRRFVSDWLPRAALESFLIVLSLLGALWLNEWNEDRQRAQRVAEARAFIIGELRANHDRLASDEIYGHHMRLRRIFEIEPNKTDRDRLEAVFANGVHPASFRDAVWRSVGMSDLLPFMEPREVFALADVYRQQDALTEMNRAAYATLVGAAPGTADPVEVARLAQVLRFYISDVSTSEEALIKSQEEALRVMGAEPPAPPARK